MTRYCFEVTYKDSDGNPVIKPKWKSAECEETARRIIIAEIFRGGGITQRIRRVEDDAYGPETCGGTACG